MIYLNKIIPIFISPLMIILYSLIISIRFSKKGTIVSIILIIIFSNPIIANFLEQFYDNSNTKLECTYNSKSDAIVVLSGMLSMKNSTNGNIIEWERPNRFLAGIDLLEKNCASVIVFTGGRLPWDDENFNEGSLLKDYAIKFGISKDKIIVTDEVQNTEQEAMEIKKLLGKNHNIILVTSSFHMNRAKYIFKSFGFNVIPNSVDLSENAGQLTIIDAFPSPYALSQVNQFIREIVGISYYRLKYMIRNPMGS